MKSKKFNSHEVQAIIAGNKTMFREVCKVQPKEHPNYVKSESITGKGYYFPFGKWKFEVGQEIFVKGQELPITLKIKSVEVERLQDISEEDCWKECGEVSTTNINNYFRNLWNSIQKKQEHEWKANPWVFVYEFEVINNKK